MTVTVFLCSSYRLSCKLPCFSHSLPNSKPDLLSSVCYYDRLEPKLRYKFDLRFKSNKASNMLGSRQATSSEDKSSKSAGKPKKERSPPAPPPSTSRYPSVKLPAGHSCQSCRTKKKKCSGERPKCNLYMHSNTECIYSVPDTSSETTAEEQRQPQVREAWTLEERRAVRWNQVTDSTEMRNTLRNTSGAQQRYLIEMMASNYSNDDVLAAYEEMKNSGDPNHIPAGYGNEG